MITTIKPEFVNLRRICQHFPIRTSVTPILLHCYIRQAYGLPQLTLPIPGVLGLPVVVRYTSLVPQNVLEYRSSVGYFNTEQFYSSACPPYGTLQGMIININVALYSLQPVSVA